jgi:hypothetical protein
MTPELTKALELAGRGHLLQLASELGRAKEELTNKHAAQGSLRSGAYVGSLLSVQLDALARYADAVVQDYAHLAVEAGATRVDDVAALKSIITGLLSGTGFLDALRELVGRIRVPEGVIMEQAERSLEALRGRALLRLETLLAGGSVTLETPTGDRVTNDWLRVHRADTPGMTDLPRTVIYQVHGPGARLSFSSVDPSTNVVTQSRAEMFATLREAIAAGVHDEAARGQLLESAEAMEAEAGGAGFASRYARFVALAADHAQVLEPFIPALAQLLMSSLA